MKFIRHDKEVTLNRQKTSVYVRIYVSIQKFMLSV